MICPHCQLHVPPNEAVAFGAHEDCYISGIADDRGNWPPRENFRASAPAPGNLKTKLPLDQLLEFLDKEET